MSQLRLIDKRPSRLIEKFGFLIHAPELLFHYLPVMELLGPERAELLLHFNSAAEEAALLQATAGLPFARRTSHQLIADGQGYRALLSNHYQGSYRLGAADDAACCYLLPALAANNVRFLYDLGADSWNFAEWNQLYDAFLCFGPWHQDRLAAFAGPKLQMGCPRFDRFFTSPCDRNQQLRELGCDPAKPVVVWLSTLGSYHGVIPHYAEAVSRLSARYNVIVKPHPFSWTQEPGHLAALEQHPFTAVIRQPFDNVILFQLADYVIADYGSSLFDALYTDCRVLLLDHPEYPGRDTDDLLTTDTEQWLRRYLPHLNLAHAGQIEACLESPRLWQEQAEVRAWLREKFFANYYGCASRIAAYQLSRLDFWTRTAA